MESTNVVEGFAPFEEWQTWYRVTVICGQVRRPWSSLHGDRAARTTTYSPSLNSPGGVAPSCTTTSWAPGDRRIMPRRSGDFLDRNRPLCSRSWRESARPPRRSTESLLLARDSPGAACSGPSTASASRGLEGARSSVSPASDGALGRARRRSCAGQLEPMLEAGSFVTERPGRPTTGVLAAQI